MSQIDLRQLRALCAIARTGSFQAAAAELGYTQSAISQQIAALERHAAVQLIGRSAARRGTVALTEAGAVLRTHAEAVLARLEAAEDDLVGLQAGVRGTLRVGFFRSLAADVLPRIMAEMGDAIEVLLHEHDTGHDLQQGVAYGDLDLSFVSLPVDEVSLTAHELFDDPYVVVVRRDDPLAARSGPIDLDDLRGRPLAGSNCPHQAMSERALVRAGVTPGVTFRADANDVLMHFAASGMAAALVPRLVAGVLPEGLVAVPADHLVPPRRIGLVTHSHRPLAPAAQRFLDTATRLSRAPRPTLVRAEPAA